MKHHATVETSLHTSLHLWYDMKNDQYYLHQMYEFLVYLSTSIAKHGHISNQDFEFVHRSVLVSAQERSPNIIFRRYPCRGYVHAHHIGKCTNCLITVRIMNVEVERNDTTKILSQVVHKLVLVLAQKFINWY